MLTIAIAVVSAFAADFTEIEVGVEYPAGTRIGTAELGLSFRIPDGWGGGVPFGAEAVVLGSMTKPGTVLVIGDTGMDAASTTLFFNQPIPIDLLTVAEPDGPALVNDKLFSQSYTVHTLQGPLAGSGRGLLSDAGSAIGFFVFMPDRDAADALADELLGSASAHKPTTPAAPSAAKPPKGKLADALKGQLLLYMKTKNGFSDKESVYLCSDGTVAIDGSSNAMSTGASVTLTHASQREDRGVWTVEGSQVVAHMNDGSRRSWTASFRPDGTIDIAESNWWVQTQSWCP